MRRPTTTAALALVAAGVLVAGAVPASAAGSAPNAFGHHDIGSLRGLASVQRALAAPAIGSSPTTSTPVTLAEHLAGPLNFAVGGPVGALYVGQAFSGQLSVIPPGGPATDLLPPAPGVDIEAVNTLDGTVTWGESTRLPNRDPLTSILKARAPSGNVRQVADLLAYEVKHNPDGKVRYGFQDLSKACLAKVPELKPYTGVVDSHVYGSMKGKYGTYVADAGGNDILKVDYRGRVSTVAVLPPTPVKITAQAAALNHLDPCVVGHTFNFESVPTDVEIAPDGKLYVSSLPGGPEDGSTGPNGSVYRVNPTTGAVNLVATGFAGATNVAIGPNGTIFVAELFGNRISSISKTGVVTPVIDLPSPAGVEYSRGHVYVSTNVFGDASIVSFTVS